MSSLQPHAQEADAPREAGISDDEATAMLQHLLQDLRQSVFPTPHNSAASSKPPLTTQEVQKLCDALCVSCDVGKAFEAHLQPCAE